MNKMNRLMKWGIDSERDGRSATVARTSFEEQYRAGLDFDIADDDVARLRIH